MRDAEDLFASDSNSCIMYSENGCWLAGRGFHWRSVENQLSEALSISGVRICRLPLIYALKGLEPGGKVSNFTLGNVLGSRLFFFFFSVSWVKNKRGFMLPHLKKTVIQSYERINGITAKY